MGAYGLEDDVAGVEGWNLAKDYYDGALPIVEDLIGKAGRRLAAWINVLAAQGTAMEEGREIPGPGSWEALEVSTIKEPAAMEGTFADGMLKKSLGI
jgi:hypothetical protein